MIASLEADEAGQMQLVEREDMDEDDDLFEAIDKLISQGINAGDVKKLQDAGIHTCNGLMMHTKKNLTGIKGLSEAKVDKICEAAEKIVRKSVVRISTGCQAGERKERDDDDDEPVPYSLVKFLLSSFCVYFMFFILPVLLHYAFP